MKNKKFTAYLNLFSFLLFLAVFYSLTSSFREFLSFIIYFLILFFGGFGITLALNRREYNPTIFILISLMIGISINYLVFILFKYLGIASNYSIITLFAVGCFLVYLNRKNAIKILKGIRIYKDWVFGISMLVLVISILLISTQIYYTKDGLYIRDATHPQYELSIANSLDYPAFPPPDLSYQGKITKYHFGYPIMVYQLRNMGVDALGLVYLLIPSFLLFIFILFLVEASKVVKKNRLRVLFILAILFSSLSIPFNKVFTILNDVAGLYLPKSMEPPLILREVSYMGSYGFAFLLTLSLFFLLKKRNLVLEGIILTGLAFTKATFFMAIAPAYGLMLFIEFLQKKDLKKFMTRVLVVIPGVVLFLVFILGTHQHNLWTIFPGSLNISSTGLNPRLLVINAIISFFIQFILFVGIGVFYLKRKILEVWSKRKIFVVKDEHYCLAIILISYALGIFISEIADGNNIQFFFPGYIFLSLFTYEYIIKRMKKVIPFIVLLVLINSAIFIGIMYIGSEANKSYELDYTRNPLITNIKLTTIRGVLNLIQVPMTSKSQGVFYPQELIDGLAFLSKAEKGTVLFSRLYETDYNKGITLWSPHGFIHTSLSGQQALVEQHGTKGIMAEKGYNERSLENLYFYLIVTGRNASEIRGLFKSDGHSYEELSYYNYLKLFSKDNYFTYNSGFFNFIYKNLKDVPDGTDWAKNYLTKNSIKYVIFERGEKPIDKSIIRPAQLVYTSNSVRIYQII